jgi:ketosteroid isomerase-like protein
MRKALISAVVLVILALCAAAQTKAKTEPTTGTEAQLIQMEHDWAKALTQKDVATLDRFIADDWTNVNPKGKVVTKSELMQSVKSADKPLEAATLTQVKAKIFGESALVTGIATEKKAGEGEERFRFMDLFAKRNGKWVAVYTQTTKIAE